MPRVGQKFMTKRGQSEITERLKQPDGSVWFRIDLEGRWYDEETVKSMVADSKTWEKWWREETRQRKAGEE